MAPLNNQRVIYLKYLISNMESLGTWHQVNTSHPSGVQAGLDFFLNTCVDNIKNLLSCGKKNTATMTSHLISRFRRAFLFIASWIWWDSETHGTSHPLFNQPANNMVFFCCRFPLTSATRCLQSSLLKCPLWFIWKEHETIQFCGKTIWIHHLHSFTSNFQFLHRWVCMKVAEFNPHFFNKPSLWELNIACGKSPCLLGKSVNQL